MIGIGERLWIPSEQRRQASALHRFMRWLASERGLDFAGFEALRAWSVADIEGFWQAVWDFFGVRSSAPHRAVLGSREMPGAQWFPGARVNYVQHLLAAGQGGKIAVRAADESGELREISWRELQAAVRRCATSLRELGVQPGDRVAAYLPNRPEALIAFMACAAIGAVWSSCSPDFGANTVIDRYSQIEPKILIATDSYRYGGKIFDRRSEVAAMRAALPGLAQLIHVPGPAGAALADDAQPWSSLFAGAAIGEGEFRFEDTAFDHPLWVVYSSGTTGLPKPFVHGHGGVLLEALKFTHFHLDLHPDACMFFFTTTGWMMWNILFSSLITGAAILLYDGHPMQPQPDRLWRLAQDAGVTMFGTSPAFLNQQMALDIHPNRRFDLQRMDAILVAGSPVMPEHMQWCLDNLRPDIWVSSQSGGTDVATAFVGGTVLLPVHAGEIQTRCLGVDVEAYDETGHPQIGEVGELVVRQPMPSMPLYFWNDPQQRRYRESYFETYRENGRPLWRHGDYLLINERGGCIISGRSDSTLNRHGVRIGTAEVYRVVDTLPGVRDSLVVNLDLPGGHSFMPLFLVLDEQHRLDDALREQIAAALRARCSPRHVPDRMYAVPAIPYTLTGKKMEVPVRKLLLGQALAQVASRDAMANPASLDWFIAYAATTRDYALT